MCGSLFVTFLFLFSKKDSPASHKGIQQTYGLPEPTNVEGTKMAEPSTIGRRIAAAGLLSPVEGREAKAAR
jgi:hypothetical protein